MFWAELPQNNSKWILAKPLLVRNALPEIANLLEPSDVMELALEEDAPPV